MAKSQSQITETQRYILAPEYKTTQLLARAERQKWMLLQGPVDTDNAVKEYVWLLPKEICAYRVAEVARVDLTLGPLSGCRVVSVSSDDLSGWRSDFGVWCMHYDIDEEAAIYKDPQTSKKRRKEALYNLAAASDPQVRDHHVFQHLIAIVGEGEEHPLLSAAMTCIEYLKWPSLDAYLERFMERSEGESKDEAERLLAFLQATRT